jgi:hypothetical protein
MKRTKTILGQWLDVAEKLPKTIVNARTITTRTFGKGSISGLSIYKTRGKHELYFEGPVGVGLLLMRGTPTQISKAMWAFAAGWYSNKCWAKEKTKRSAAAAKKTAKISKTTKGKRGASGLLF